MKNLADKMESEIFFRTSYVIKTLEDVLKETEEINLKELNKCSID